MTGTDDDRGHSQEYIRPEKHNHADHNLDRRLKNAPRSRIDGIGGAGYILGKPADKVSRFMFLKK